MKDTNNKRFLMTYTPIKIDDSMLSVSEKITNNKINEILKLEKDETKRSKVQ